MHVCDMNRLLRYVTGMAIMECHVVNTECSDVILPVKYDFGFYWLFYRFLLGFFYCQVVNCFCV